MTVAIRRIGTRTRGVPQWLVRPIQMAASAVMYLCEHPRDHTSREYVRRVLAELAADARGREDAETCATALRLTWTIDDEGATAWELYEVAVELRNLGRNERWI